MIRLLLLIALLHCSPALAAEPPVVVALNNGATLIVATEPNSSLVVFDLFFRVGVAEEGASEGIGALVSRSWIGPAQARTDVLISRDIGGLGGNVGTFFGGDFSEIWAVASSAGNAPERAAQTLFTLVGDPQFTDAYVAEARRDLLRQLVLDEDVLFSGALGDLRRRAWSASSPYGRSPLGSERALRALTAQQVRTFYHRFFAPDRAVIVVMGNITPERARRLVSSSWEAGQAQLRRPSSPPIRPVKPDVIPAGLGALPLARRAPARLALAGFLAPGVRDLRPSGYVTLLVLEALMGGGKGSRLFQRRDTQGVGYEIGTTLQPGLYQSLLVGYAAARNENDLPSVLREEAASLLRTPPTEAEVVGARARVLGRRAASRQRLKDRSFALGWAAVMGLGPDFENDFAKRVAAVTADGIAHLAHTVLEGTPAVVFTQTP